MTQPDSLPVEEARKKFADILDGTQHHSQHVEITRRGKRAGIVVPPEWYDRAVGALTESAAVPPHPTEPPLRKATAVSRHEARPAASPVGPPEHLRLSPEVAALPEERARQLAGQVEAKHPDWGREIRRELRGIDPKWMKYAIVEAAAQVGYVDLPGGTSPAAPSDPGSGT